MPKANRNGKKRWTAEEDKHLLKHVEAGVDKTDIGAILGRSAVSVAQRKKRLGIHERKHWTAAEDDRLRQLLTETDLPLADIAKRMDRTANSIERRKERLKIHRKPFKLYTTDPAHVAQIVKFKMAGWTHQKIAEAFEFKHFSRISHILLKNGYHRFCVVHSDKTYVRWTEDDREVIRKCLKKRMKLCDIQRHLPNRSIPSINGQINQMRKKMSAEPIKPKPKPTESILNPEFLELRKQIGETLMMLPQLSDHQVASRYNCLPEFVRRERQFHRLQQSIPIDF